MCRSGSDGTALVFKKMSLFFTLNVRCTFPCSIFRNKALIDDNSSSIFLYNSNRNKTTSWRQKVKNSSLGQNSYFFGEDRKSKILGEDQKDIFLSETEIFHFLSPRGCFIPVWHAFLVVTTGNEEKLSGTRNS